MGIAGFEPEHLKLFSERPAVFGLSDLEREALARGRERAVTIDDVSTPRQSRSHSAHPNSPTL